MSEGVLQALFNIDPRRVPAAGASLFYGSPLRRTVYIEIFKLRGVDLFERKRIVYRCFPETYPPSRCNVLAELAADYGFFEAPASTKYHGNFAGGLVLHSLHVFYRMSQNCVYEFGRDCGEGIPFPPDRMESIAIAALLHDICKAEFYKIDYKNQKVYSEQGRQFDKRGAYSWESVPFYTVDEKFPFGHGEKSVFLINEHMRLTRDEALAIRFHMGDFTDRNTGKAYEMCPLALQLHIADLQATYLDESAQKADKEG